MPTGPSFSRSSFGVDASLASRRRSVHGFQAWVRGYNHSYFLSLCRMVSKHTGPTTQSDSRMDLRSALHCARGKRPLWIISKAKIFAPRASRAQLLPPTFLNPPTPLMLLLSTFQCMSHATSKPFNPFSQSVEMRSYAWGTLCAC